MNAMNANEMEFTTMLKKAIKIVVAVVILLVVFDFVLSMFAIKDTPRSHYVRMDFRQLSLAITTYYVVDGGAIPTDISELHDFAVKGEYLGGVEQLHTLTFKDNLIYDCWGSEIIYSYDVDSDTCSFISFGQNKVDNSGEKDDIIYEDVVGI